MFIIKGLLFLWQLPQNIIGLVIRFFCHKDKSQKVYWAKNFARSGVSLGNFIILDECYKHDITLKNTIAHERGHQVQSKILGPLYLIIIGLPSFIANIHDRIMFSYLPQRLKLQIYYSRPWEYLADRLGRVDRLF